MNLTLRRLEKIALFEKIGTHYSYTQLINIIPPHFSWTVVYTKSVDAKRLFLSEVSWCQNCFVVHFYAFFCNSLLVCDLNRTPNCYGKTWRFLCPFFRNLHLRENLARDCFTSTVSTVTNSVQNIFTHLRYCDKYTVATFNNNLVWFTGAIYFVVENLTTFNQTSEFSVRPAPGPA